MATGCQGETLEDSEFKDLLENEDENSFYKVDSHDDRTVVAVTKVALEPSEICYLFRSQTKDKNHAEVDVIRKTMDWLKETDLIERTTVRVTTMVTYSPCSKCQSKLKKMLEEMIAKYNTVKYTLRISFLYHETTNGKRETDEDVRHTLSVWKWQLKGLGVDFTLQAISVCDELQDHTPRPVKCKTCKSKIKKNEYDKSCSECKLLTRHTNPKRKEFDCKIIDNVKKINDSPRPTFMNEYLEPI